MLTRFIKVWSAVLICVACSGDPAAIDIPIVIQPPLPSGMVRGCYDLYSTKWVGARLSWDGSTMVLLRAGGGAVVPMWPPGFRAISYSGVIDVISPSGESVARVGIGADFQGTEKGHPGKLAVCRVNDKDY